MNRDLEEQVVAKSAEPQQAGQCDEEAPPIDLESLRASDCIAEGGSSFFPSLTM